MSTRVSHALYSSMVTKTFNMSLLPSEHIKATDQLLNSMLRQHPSKRNRLDYLPPEIVQHLLETYLSYNDLAKVDMFYHQLSKRLQRVMYTLRPILWFDEINYHNTYMVKQIMEENHMTFDVGSDLSIPQLHSIASTIRNLPSLHTVCFKAITEGFGDAGLSILVDAIKTHKQLVRFELELEHITIEGIKMLRACTNLTTFGLIDNGVEITKDMLQLLGSMQHLTTLDLSDNVLVYQDVVDAFKHNDTLQTLRIIRNDLTPQDIQLLQTMPHIHYVVTDIPPTQGFTIEDLD